MGILWRAIQGCLMLALIVSSFSGVALGQTGLPKWLLNTENYGDIRLRYQYEEKTDAEDRHRGRLRFRYGVETKVTDEIMVRFRLASGGEDQVSTNQTLESTFSSKAIWLDQAYVKLSPTGNVHLVGGKMKNPFFCTDLVWDDDVNPEGAAVMFHRPSRDMEVFVIAGVFPVAELKNSSSDPILYGLQGGFSSKGVNRTVRAGVSYYNFSNLRGAVLEDISTGYVKRTNTLRENGNDHIFVYGYELFDVAVEFVATEIPMGSRSLPVALRGDFAQNIADDVGEKTSWLVGFVLGSAKNSGQWQLCYDYRVIKKDAVLATINDSDFHGGGTNAKGHKISFKINLLDNPVLGITYFQTEEVIGDKKQHNTLQVDFSTKF